MADLGMTFDVNEMPQSTNNFEPLPAGWYTATISKADKRDTKNGTGEYISMRFDVSGPTHQGRVVFTNLNTKNANPKAEEIGLQQLGSIMRAIGVSRVTNTDQLIGGSLSIKVTIKNDDYGTGNEVKGYKAMEGSAPPMPAATAAAPAKAAPPWAPRK